MADPTDTFENVSKYRNQLDAPPRHHVAVTKSNTTGGPGNIGYDATDRPGGVVCRGLYIGVGGDVVVVMLGPDGAESDETYKNVPSGSWLVVRAHRVHSTGTTASDIVAVW